jgi:MFS family permease
MSPIQTSLGAASRSARWSQVFAWLGHGYMHLLVALYLTIVLSLEREWNIGYSSLIGLWTVGAFLVGAGAPLAGWLGDRWSNPWMMVVFFVGSGAATVACGMANSPTQLAVALAGLGVFASIYHPVGMAWLIKTAANRGTSLGVWGSFGGFGVALAGFTAGGLIDLVDWRAAFWVPGLISIATGLVLVGGLLTGQVVEQQGDRTPHKEPPRGDVVRAFIVMSVTVFLAGLIYQATQIAMPKALSERMPDFFAGGAFGVGALFTAIYVVGGFVQIFAGWLTDRFSLRTAYLFSYCLQVPVMAVGSALVGFPFFLAALLMVMSNVGSLPAENALMARYTPSKWRGSAFGAKFVLSLGVGPVAVQLVSYLHERTGEFSWLYITLAGAAAIVAVAILMLPKDRADDMIPAPVNPIGADPTGNAQPITVGPITAAE